jgi:hypothetical protein
MFPFSKASIWRRPKMIVPPESNQRADAAGITSSCLGLAEIAFRNGID